MENVIELLGWTLIHFLWQGALAGVVLAAMLRAIPDARAAARAALAQVALLTMLAMPCVTAWLLMLPYTGERLPGIPGIVFELATAAPRAEMLESWVPFITLLWMLWVGAQTIRIGGGAALLWRRHRDATEGLTEPLQARAAALAAELGLRLARVRVSTREVIPHVTGLARPVVIMPACARAYRPLS